MLIVNIQLKEVPPFMIKFLLKYLLQRKYWLFWLSGLLSLVFVLGIGAYTVPTIAQAVNRTVLPIPEPSFQGKIERSITDSVPDFSQQITARQNDPNVLSEMEQLISR